MLLLCVATCGFLISMEHRCQRQYDKRQQPSLREIERRLEAESDRLDIVIADLLREHNSLVSAPSIPQELYVTPEMEARFKELEAQVKKENDSV